MGKLILLCVVVAGLYFWLRPEPSSPVTMPTVAAPPAVSGTYVQPRTSGRSGGFGSGHQAGYAWAEKNDVDDVSVCEEAGEHSNSPSFAEGCEAYVAER